MGSQIQILLVGVMGIIFSLCCPVDTFTFKLSQLLYDVEDDFYDDRPVFPRRDLKEELGEEGYNCLVESALVTDGGKCLNVENRKDNEAPTLSPIHEDKSRGVDISFPSQNHGAFLTQADGSTKMIYDDFMEGCDNEYGSICSNSENDRFDMNLNQPRFMQNYTTLGFQKTKAPEYLMRTLRKFWENNQAHVTTEIWSKGNTYVNHWNLPTYMLHVDNPRLEGGGMLLKNRIWEAAEKILSKWIETKKYALDPASLYGIRIYKEGAILAPHVDRLPLVTSAVINVAQDLDEPWPIELYAHDGKAYNVTLEPGEMLLYESASVIHGRPYPMKGRFYANVFVHFEPSGHSIRHGDRMDGNQVEDDAEELYHRAQRRASTKVYGNLSHNKIPYFIPAHLAGRWQQKTTYPRNMNDLRKAQPPSLANRLAASGQLRELKKLVAEDPAILSRGDENGWAPIHEAARGCQTNVIKYLIEKKVDLNVRTNSGRGATAVWWAEEENGHDRECVTLLTKAGGIRQAPKRGNE